MRSCGFLLTEVGSRFQRFGLRRSLDTHPGPRVTDRTADADRSGIVRLNGSFDIGYSQPRDTTACAEGGDPNSSDRRAPARPRQNPPRHCP